jgi:hypothetical protein
MTRIPRVLSLVFLVVLVVPITNAQPFGAWLSLPGYTNTAHARIPANAALNPTSAFTFEAWVAITNSGSGEDCHSSSSSRPTTGRS